MDSILSGLKCTIYFSSKNKNKTSLRWVSLGRYVAFLGSYLQSVIGLEYLFIITERSTELLAEEPVWTCQKPQRAAEADRRPAMALLTLHRIPSIATAPVRQVIHTPLRTQTFSTASSDVWQVYSFFRKLGILSTTRVHQQFIVESTLARFL